MRDVALRAGVSISTVSNFLNQKGHISDEKKENILKAIQELDYCVDPVARGLKSEHTKAIGLIITNINRYFFTQVIKGIQDVATKKGYSITLCDSNDNFESEVRFIKELINNRVDGIILDSVVGKGEQEYFKYISDLHNRTKKIHVVSLERKFDYGIDSVSVDNYSGARLATKHLADCGCENIIHIAGPLNSSFAQERKRGFLDQMSSCGLNLDESLQFIGDFSPSCGYLLMKEALLKVNSIDGVFASNDQMAIGCISAIKESGYRIPEDIKVVGFDNTFVSSLVSPSLSTINVLKYKMGSTAAEIMLERLLEEGTGPVRSVELPINLIVRQSTELRGVTNWDLYEW
jgi:DNA-binding LacI/PurR family transcriptional regulator